jgi:hypothetical protein
VQADQPGQPTSIIGRVAWAFIVAVLFAYAVHLLARSPCLGVADIGDFWRVMRPAGIEHIEPLTHHGEFVRCTFKTKEADLKSTFSSTAVLAWIAKGARWGLPTQPGQMDLRQMGLLYLLLVAAIVTWAFAGRLPGAAVAALLYVMVDPGYLLFMNSFYGDPAHLIALLGLLVWWWRWGSLPPAFWEMTTLAWSIRCCALIALVFLGAAAKMQFILLPAVVLTVLVVPLAINGRRAPVRASVLGGALLFLSILVPLHFYFGAGPRFLWANNYHAVYGGILRVSSDPEQVLNGLGISQEYWRLPRRDVFAAGVALDHPVHRELEDLSRLRLLGIYLKDPKAMIAMAGHAQRVLSAVETHPRGNRVRDPHRPEKATYQTWWQFSRLRGRLFGAWPPVPWFLLGGTALWLAVSLRHRRWDGVRSLCLFLLVWAGSQWMVVVLGEGLITFKQHMVVVRFTLDLLLVVLVYDLARAWLTNRRRPPLGRNL